ncbi:hypothetical protein C8F04DRAFT_1253967 [Mycena alexandri]|uniref:Uncharacterized protein n=1 Tax=Mycena alexandri TaxID=1745969 RepID=A0AAD6X5Y5_9AGAR|nr:hypothetical protein C8F04DRAFT_1253967 [Mycena alexandri]
MAPAMTPNGTEPAATAPATKPAATAAATPAPSKSKKKPGNKGDFHGTREEFLVSQLPAYLDASKRGKTRDFWPMLFKAWFERYHWRLELDQEPTPTDLFPPDNLLTTEEFMDKGKKQNKLKEKLKTWYNHRRTSMGLVQNPFSDWLARLRLPAEKPPKRITDYQYYMQHEDFKDAVKEKFDADHWDAPRREHLALRCKIARAMFEQEPEAVKIRMREEARHEQEEEVRAWRDAKSGLPDLDPEEQAEARARFSGVVMPLLQALRAHTGFHITLLAGRIEGSSVDLVSVHAGSTKPDGVDGGADFTEWDPSAYKEKRTRKALTFPCPTRKRAPMSQRPTTGPVPSPRRTAPLLARRPTLQPPYTFPFLRPSTRKARRCTAYPPSPMTLTRPPQSPSLTRPPQSPSLTRPPQSPGRPAANPANRPASTPRDVRKEGARTAEEEVESRIDSLAIIEADLRAELAALPLAEREARVHALEAMGMLELRRTNNLAASEAGVARGKAQTAEAAAAAMETVQGKKRKAAAKTAPKPKKRARKTQVQLDGSEESDEGEEAVREEPVITRGRDAEAAGAKGAEGAEARAEAAILALAKKPKWAAHGWEVLAMGMVKNKKWMEMLELWWKLEASTKYATSPKGFSTNGRPGEIHTWIKNARKVTPKIEDVPAFIRNFKSWWLGLNPEWRVRDGVLVKEGVGSWEEMRQPGANGFLGVLIALRWWLEADGESEDWKAMLDDVTWVIGALIPGTP